MHTALAVKPISTTDEHTDQALDTKQNFKLIVPPATTHGLAKVFFPLNAEEGETIIFLLRNSLVSLGYLCVNSQNNVI